MMTQRIKPLLIVTCAILVVNTTPADEGKNPEKDNGGPNQPAERDKGNALPAAVRNSKEGKVFAAYDKDKDSFVTAEEIEAMLEGKQNSRGRREIRKAVHRADKDQDKKLNFDEFKFWYTVGRRDEKAENR